MSAALAVAVGLLLSGADSERILRQLIAQAAVAQVARIDPAWEPAQRDCAGLVRFAFRTAYRQVQPQRLAAGLWSPAPGAPDFADAQTLLRTHFVSIGRGPEPRRALRSGDLAAFRQAGDGEPVYHRMLIVVPPDPAHAEARVVYHPGEANAAVRSGTLESLVSQAPLAWRPVEDNPAFLGFFRFKEWMP